MHPADLLRRFQQSFKLDRPSSLTQQQKPPGHKFTLGTGSSFDEKSIGSLFVSSAEVRKRKLNNFEVLSESTPRDIFHITIMLDLDVPNTKNLILYPTRYHPSPPKKGCPRTENNDSVVYFKFMPRSYSQRQIHHTRLLTTTTSAFNICNSIYTCKCSSI